MSSENIPPRSPLELSEKSQKIKTLFDKIADRYDFLNRLLSVGNDVRWRNHLLQAIPHVANKAGVLCDVACGTGDVAFAVARYRKDYTSITGFDISPGMLQKAHLRKTQYKTPLEFCEASAEALPVEKESVDCVTISFGLRNVDHREKAISEFHRILKPGGALLVLEFFPTDKNHFMTKIFDFYFKKILPRIAGFFSDKEAYTYLPTSVGTMPSGAEFIHLLERQGFTCISQKQWLSGTTRLFTAYKKS